jgi:translation elongation factor EF-Tu-like GTPase
MAEISTTTLDVTLHLLATELGGRLTPIRSDVYRPQFRLGSASSSCRVDKLQREPLSPGEVTSGTITLVNPDIFGLSLRVGATFELMEGKKKVGWGSIQKLYD